MVNYGLNDSEEGGAQTKLDAGDKVVIRSAFQKEIKAGQLLTKHQVRLKMRTDRPLRQCGGEGQG